jgi:SOS-response transcriptional repressor LexA
VVDRSADGRLVVALVGEEFVCKRLRRDGDRWWLVAGGWWLVVEHPGYPDLPVTE